MIAAGVVQGGPFGRGTLFVDINVKFPPLYKLLILKSNSYSNVNKRPDQMTRWTTMYSACRIINVIENVFKVAVILT